MERDLGDNNVTEAQLITYLKNILKVQIRPMNYSALADLVADAPKKLRKKFNQYVQENYPAAQFLDFLAKYPDIFHIRQDRTVVLTDGNDFTRNPLEQQNRTLDQVDGSQGDRIPDEVDKAEYVSDSNSSGSSDDEQDTDKDDQEAQVLLEDTFGGDLVRVRLETMNGSEASISSDSEDGAFITENVVLDAQSNYCSCVSDSCSCSTPSSEEN